MACSEFIPTGLLELFDKIARERSHDVVACVRDSYTCGELIPLFEKKFGNVPSSIERFMNKNGVAIDKVEIHQRFHPLDPSRIIHLPRDPRYTVIHLRDSDTLSLIKKHTDYAVVEARDRARNGRTITGSKLFFLIMKELLLIFRVPFKQWNRIAFREIWARLVMDSIIYWIGWELRTGTSIDYSRRKNDDLWARLVNQNSQNALKDRCNAEQ